MRALGRWLLLVLGAALALQVFFLGRIALTAWVAPQSTTFERTQIWQLWRSQPLDWRQHWVDYAQIATSLKQAVLTAEDDGFVEHRGVQWEAMERAWQRNQQALERAEQRPANQRRSVPIYGGSTITQQLAKNLLLSGERSFWRKGQELLLAHALELLLSKQRIFELYLNHAEWGAGIFGAEAAAQHYFHHSAANLTPQEAARLAVMLPRPRYYQANPQSSYLQSRTRTIARRMAVTAIP